MINRPYGYPRASARVGGGQLEPWNDEDPPTEGRRFRGRDPLEIDADLSKIPDPDPQIPVFRCMDLDELGAVKPLDWILPGFLARKHLGLLVSPPQAGKTALIVDLAVSATTGLPWSDIPIKKPLVIVYCAGEGENGLKRRIDTAIEIKGADRKAVLKHLFVVNQVPQLFSTSSPKSPARFVRDVRARLLDKAFGRPDLVVLDTLHTATEGGDENSSRDMGVVVKSLRYIRDELDTAILASHHTTKEGSSYRGSSALHGDFDALHVIDYGESTRKLRAVKVRDSGLYVPRGFEIATTEDDSAYVRWTGPSVVNSEYKRPPTADERIKELLATAAEPQSREEIAEALELSISTIKSAVQRLLAAGELEVGKRGRAEVLSLVDSGRVDEQSVALANDPVVPPSQDDDDNSGW